MTMSLKSVAFAHDGPIPQRYSCDGADVSPPLEWRGVPTDAKSLALIIEDPDAPDPAAPRSPGFIGSSTTFPYPFWTARGFGAPWHAAWNA